MENIEELCPEKWLALSDRGFWINYFAENETVCYSTKQEIIEDIAVAEMDEAKKPHVRRLGPGHYEYTPKHNGYYDEDSYTIVRLTAANIEKYQRQYTLWVKSEEENQ